MDDAERAFRDALHRVDSVKIPVPSLEPAEVNRTPGLGIMAARWLAAAAVLAMVAGLAVWALTPRGQAVTAIPVAPPTVATTAKLTGTTWIAVEFHGKPTVLAADRMPSLEFRPDSTFSGADPCNRIGGTYQLVGNQLTITRSGGSRLVGCNPPQQQAFQKVLADTRRVFRDGDTIEFLDQSGSVLARFRSGEAYTEPGPPGPILVTPSRGPEPTPTLATSGPARVQIRIRNASSLDFEQVQVNFSGGRVAYGTIAAGAQSGYHETQEAYGYADVQLTAAGREYRLQPVDHVGETELAPGRYTYVLDLDGTRMSLRLEAGK